MKIIKPGLSKEEREKATRLFYCDICLCLFEANKGEYSKYVNDDGDYYCTCPNCKSTAYEK